VSAAVPPQPPVIFDFFAPVNDDGGSRQDSFFATQSSSSSTSEQYLSTAHSSVLSVQQQYQSTQQPPLNTTAQHPPLNTSATASSFITMAGNGNGNGNGERWELTAHKRVKSRVTDHRVSALDSSAALLQRSNKEGGHGSVSVSPSYAHPNPFELLSSTDSSLVLSQASSSSSAPTPTIGITPAESTTIIPSTSRGLAPLPRRSHEQRSASTSTLSIRNGGYRGGSGRPPHPPSSVQLPNENRKSIAH